MYGGSFTPRILLFPGNHGEFIKIFSVFCYVECGDWKLQVKKTCDMQVALGTPPQVLVEISTSKCESVLQLFSQTHSKTDANYMINAGLGALHLFSFQMFVQGTR